MPIFDLDNAVQQGFNRDPLNNDWNVEARNLEIVLEDNAGASEFRVHDIDNVAVIVGDSDGYFSVLGNAEVHGGNILVEGPNVSNTNTAFVTLRDTVDESSLFLVDADPNGSVTGTRGSVALNYSDGYIHVNRDDATNWDRVAFFDETDDTVTLQIAYNNDVDGGDATITTDVTDGAVIIAGTEKLQVTATGGFDLDTGFDMNGAGPFDVDITGIVSIDADAASNFSVDGANLTLETITSGDVLVNVPGGGVGDFILSDGTSDYIVTESSVSELRLGDGTGTTILTRVMDDLVVTGDLQVDGYETILNTEQLFVEDRLIRLNINAPASFSGTTGFEAEVGSDGYVEFHWDDTTACWEISIDRSLTPSAQTFRPLPYLAASPATKDLSATGVDGYSAHNSTSGAAIVNTDKDNYPQSFGLLMLGDSVQHALEAIDAYMVYNVTDAIADAAASVTLQVAYDNGGNAIIVTNATDGSVVISGTESLQVTADGGIVLTSLFDADIDAGDSFDVDLTGGGGFHFDAYGPGANSNITVDQGDLVLGTTTSGITTINGATGIVLDGDGYNVIPKDSCTDSLGDPTHGWSEVYVCDIDGDVVGLTGVGASSAHNDTAGAHGVGTNSNNFNTFGTTMVDDTVQSALEAIDSYLSSIDSNLVTLQSAYSNDVDGGDATITTDATDGALVIAGTEKLQVTATGGFDLDTGFDADIGSGSAFDVDLTGGGGFHIDAYGPGAHSNVTVTQSDLVLGTAISGVTTINGATGIVLDADGYGVIPKDSCTDSLGDATHGWANLYICDIDGDVVCLTDVGNSGTAHNDTAGSHAVGTNSTNFETFGPDMTDNTLQSALEAIDGYFKTLSIEDIADTTFTQVRGLELNGAVLNGHVKTSNVSGTATLEFKKSKTNRAQWTVPVPVDWDGLSDIVVEIVWSPENTNTGDVLFRLEYKSLSLTELASTAVSTVDYTQAGGGTADAIQSTGTNLSIPAGDINVNDEIMVINVVRRGAAGGDTFTGKMQMHMVKYSYTAENIV